MRRVDISQRILDAILNENNDLRLALRKCDPYTFNDEGGKDRCIFCGQYRCEKHRNDCEYMILAYGEQEETE